MKLGAVNANTKIPLEEIRNEWLETSSPFDIRRISEHFNIFQDLYGEAYFVPRVPLNIKYLESDDISIQVYHGNQIKPYEVIF